MKCKQCRGDTCEPICYECHLLENFNSGEAIDDSEELLEMIPEWLEELVSLRKRAGGLV